MNNAIDKELKVQQLAAVVLYKQLHRVEKDPYDILAEFIKALIAEKGIRKFSTVDMKIALAKNFGFDNLPDNVVKNAIYRTNMVVRDDKYFILENSEYSNDMESMFEKMDKELKKNNDILNDVCEYIGKKKNKIIDDETKKKISRDFCSYLFDSGTDGEYLPEIASYIIKNKKDRIDFANRMDDITEGIYEYSALTYNQDISKIDSLKNYMTIFLDTDILLSLGGYHGEIHQRYVEEMIALLYEINRKTGKKYISIKYFDFVQTEINEIFSAAEYIIKGNKIKDFSREAVINIVDGCKSVEDVIMEQSRFWGMLKSKSICCDEKTDYYTDELKKYNVEDDNLAMQISKNLQMEKKEVEKALKRISHINKLRKGNQYNYFEDIKYIFISDNRKNIRVSTYVATEKNTYFYAMTCYRITNILWIKMNKGLSKGNLPSSLDIVMKSKAIISKYTNEKMHYEIEKLRKELEEGKCTEQAVVEAILRFREIARKPEDITEDVVEDNLVFIEENNIVHYGEELALYKERAKEQEAKSAETKKNADNFLLKTQEYIENKNLLNDLLNKMGELNRKKSALIEQNEIIAAKIKKINKRLRVLFVFLGICVNLAVPSYLLLRYSWDQLEPITYWLSGIFPTITFIYELLIKRVFSISDICDIVTEKYEKHLLKKYNTSEVAFDEINQMLDMVQIQAADIKRRVDLFEKEARKEAV